MEATDVVTSPQAAVRLLGDLVPAEATVLVVGGEGLVARGRTAGFIVTRSADDKPAAVIQGFDPEVGWKQLAEASFALHDRASRGWRPTPTGRSRSPAVSLRATAPSCRPCTSRSDGCRWSRASPSLRSSRRRSSVSVPTKPLFIGDRLDTDIRGANRVGMESVLVLTGIDGPKQLLAAAAG